MPWVTFDRDFDWRVPSGVKSHTVIAYKAGQKALVKQQCADDAKAAGALAEEPATAQDGKDRVGQTQA